MRHGTPSFDSGLERRRLSIVDRLDIPELRGRAVFEHVAQAIADEAASPIGKVSLIGADTQYLLAEKGLGVDELPRRDSICNYPVASGELFVVENAAEHPELEDNPHVVGEPFVRFYVGIPLIIDSVPVGTVCAVDGEPKALEWTSRSSIFRVVGLLERLIAAHLEGDVDDSSSRSLLLEQLTSAEAHAIRLRAVEQFGEKGRRAVSDLRSALHGADEQAKSSSIEPTGLGHADTLADDESR